MQPDLPVSCPSCQAIVSVGGGRCPTCGYELPASAPSRAVAPPASSQLAPGVLQVRRGEAQRRTRQLLMGGVMIGGATVVIGGLLLFALPDNPKSEAPVVSASAAAPAAAPSNPDDMGIVDATYVIPTELMPRARTRARVWDRHAQLVSLKAHPIVKGHVDTKAGGVVVFEFAKPEGKRLGPGAPLSSQRLRIRIDKSGTKTSEVKGSAIQVAAAEPSCPFPEVWQKAVASGVPKDSGPEFHYFRDKASKREVWTVRQLDADGGSTLLRTVDGFKCTIILR